MSQSDSSTSLASDASASGETLDAIAAIHEATDFEAVAAAAVRAVASAVTGRRAFLIMHDDGKVVLSATHGMENPEGQPEAHSELFALVDKTLATGRPQVRYSPPLGGEAAIAAACVPLNATPREVAAGAEPEPSDGALFVDREGTHFSDGEMAAIEAIAHHALVALRNLAATGPGESSAQMPAVAAADTAELHRLRERVAELEREKDELDSWDKALAGDKEMDSLREQVADLTAKLEAAERGGDGGKGKASKGADPKELEKLRAKVDKLQQKADEAEKLRGQLKNLEKRAGQAEELRVRVSELEKQLGDARAAGGGGGDGGAPADGDAQVEIDMLKLQLAGLRKELDESAKGVSSDGKRELERLRVKIADLESENVKLKSAAKAEAPAGDTWADGKVVELERTIAAEREKLAEAAREAEELRQQVSAMEQLLEEAGNKQGDDPEVGRLRARLAAFEKAERDRQAMEESGDTWAVPREKAEETEKEAAELRDRIAQLERERDDLRRAADDAAAAANERNRKEIEKLREQVSVLEAEVSAARAEGAAGAEAELEALREKAAELEQLKEEIAGERSEMKRLKNRLADLELVADRALDTVPELEELRKKVSDLEKYRDDSQKLQALRQSIKGLGEVTNEAEGQLDDFMIRVLDQCLGITHLSRGLLLMLDDDGAEPVVKIGRTRTGETITDAVPFSRSVTHTALTTKKPKTIISALHNKLEGGGTRSIVALGLQTLICVPLMDGEEVLGVVYLDSADLQGEIGQADLDFVVSLCGHATSALIKARAAAAVTDRKRVANELDLAQQIQLEMLPKTIPEVEKLEIFGTMVPAKEIGGDYYDFLPHAGTNKEVTICIGDVSGKGVAAGLVMMMARSILRSIVTVTGRPESTTSIVRSLNSVLCRDIHQKGIFMSLNCLTWDSTRQIVRYTGAGHEHILIYRASDQSVETIRAGGVAVGLSEGVNPSYSEREIHLGDGDQLVLYTDGITEAMDAEEQEFGLSRFAAILETYGDRTPIDLVNSILDEVKQFRGLAPQTDDITLVALRAKPMVFGATAADDIASLLDDFPE